MDAAGIDRAALVGASLGGSVVLEVAVAAPERVSALVLAGSGLPAHAWSQDVRDYWAVEEAAIERGDLDAAADANVRFWVGPADAGGAGAGARRCSCARSRCRCRSARPLADEPLVAGLDDRLGEIAAPALVVVGALDHADIHAIAARLVDALPHATRAEIPAAAHLPSLEQPGRLRRGRGAVPRAQRRTGLSDRAIATISGSVRSSSSVFCTQ